MADLVRFESSRDVLAVKRGGVVNVETGGQLQFDGVKFTPGGGGSSTLAALTDVALTSPADGDLFSYDAGSGKWINSGNLRIGLSYGYFTGIDLSDGFVHRVPVVDDAGNNGQIYLNYGFTINGNADGFIVGTKGRYRVMVSASGNRDATAWWSLALVSAPTILGSTNGDIVPASLSSGFPPYITYTDDIEVNAGDELFFTAVALGTPAAGSSVNIVNILVQYLGPATSL